MIAYFDTSAIVPLVIREHGTATARRLWAAADRVVTVALAYPEARAALAQAERTGCIPTGDLQRYVAAFEQVHDQLDLVRADVALLRHAGDLAEAHALRGYDAVHLAAADRLRSPDLVLVTGDEAQLTAATARNLATTNILPR